METVAEFGAAVIGPIIEERLHTIAEDIKGKLLKRIQNDFNDFVSPGVPSLNDWVEPTNAAKRPRLPTQGNVRIIQTFSSTNCTVRRRPKKRNKVFYYH